MTLEEVKNKISSTRLTYTITIDLDIIGEIDLKQTNLWKKHLLEVITTKRLKEMELKPTDIKVESIKEF